MINRVADMTLEELEQLIDARIQMLYRKQDERTTEEILADIDKHMWIPPAGTPSVLDMIREDRDA